MEQKKGMKQSRGHYPGNTIAEYSVMIGLVAVASIGALSLFGGSVSKVLNQPSQGSNANTLNNMAQIKFGGGFSSQGGGANYAVTGNNSVTARSVAATPGGDGTVLNQALMGTGSSDGVNATSVDGNVKVQAVHKTVTSAQKLQDIADSLPDGAMKEWYKNAAIEAFLLAGNEASLSYRQDNIQSLKDLAEPNMQVGDALYEMGNHYSQLGSALLNIPTDATPKERAQAAALVNGIMDSMHSTYADTLDKYTTMADTAGRRTMTLNVAQLQADNMTYGQANYTKTADQVKAMAGGIVSSGAADSTPAVKTSLTNGITLDSK
ncbi:MAG: hypothetical protein K0Q50_1794 [Vampirovibrio sp.]|jgi:Flp pilus assembly pilin Flp|nr:hypothetical protein [Vampirovibrio sp.]